MSLTFHIEAPEAGANQLAFKTRAALSEFIQGAEPLLQAPRITALDKSTIQSLKAEGAAAYAEEMAAYHGRPLPIGCLPFSYMLRAFGEAFNKLDRYNISDVRAYSYKFEGLVRAYQADMHKAGIKASAEQHAMQLAYMNSDYVGSSWSELVTEKLGVARYEGPRIHGQFTPLSEQMGLYACYYKVSHGYDHALAACLNTMFADMYNAPVSMWGSVQERGYIHGPLVAVVPYFEEDGPWVAGFATPLDMCRMRFTRVRLGSWLSTIGCSDSQVKQLVEKAKSTQAGGSFRVFPNDIRFGSIYTGMAEAVNSCMAGPASDYYTWDGIHPTDVYSASWFGSEDNNLALFVFEVAEELVGRGIVNTRTMKCVRWYGNVAGERALRRCGIKVDGSAFKGSWLACVRNSREFIAPYLDGDLDYVKDVGNKLMIGESGLYASETSGVLGVEEVYCIDTDDYADRDDCTYQPESNTWISSECDDWRCPIIGEWAPEGERETVFLDGEETEVHPRVVARISTYLRSTDATDGMLEEFADWDDESGEMVDASGVPENYTRRPAWGGYVEHARPVQWFSRDESPLAQAAAPAPVLAACVAQQLPAAMSIYAQMGCACTDCRIERGELL